jgi:hypothetical protein
VAPGVAPPVVSVTLPRSVAVVPPTCAKDEAGVPARRAAAHSNDTGLGTVRIETVVQAVPSDAREFTSGDASIHLTRKEIDLLLLLLEQRPNVVTKEQIYGHLWPNIFVSEASLQALVSDLPRCGGMSSSTIDCDNPEPASS